MALSDERRRRIEVARSHARERQLELHLRNYLIRRAGLQGFGVTRIATLESNNVVTAWDVRRDVSPHGARHWPRLVATSCSRWANGAAASFRFDPAKTADAQDLARIDAEIGGEQARIQRQLLAGPRRLRNLRAEVEADRERRVKDLYAARAEAAQARADASCWGSPVPDQMSWRRIVCVSTQR